jgi:hypothetical protein
MTPVGQEKIKAPEKLAKIYSFRYSEEAYYVAPYFHEAKTYELP